MKSSLLQQGACLALLREEVHALCQNISEHRDRMIVQEILWDLDHIMLTLLDEQRGKTDLSTFITEQSNQEDLSQTHRNWLQKLASFKENRTWLSGYSVENPQTWQHTRLRINECKLVITELKDCLKTIKKDKKKALFHLNAHLQNQKVQSRFSKSKAVQWQFYAWAWTILGYLTYFVFFPFAQTTGAYQYRLIGQIITQGIRGIVSKNFPWPLPYNASLPHSLPILYTLTDWCDSIIPYWQLCSLLTHTPLVYGSLVNVPKRLTRIIGMCIATSMLTVMGLWLNPQMTSLLYWLAPQHGFMTIPYLFCLLLLTLSIQDMNITAVFHEQLGPYTHKIVLLPCLGLKFMERFYQQLFLLCQNIISHPPMFICHITLWVFYPWISHWLTNRYVEMRETRLSDCIHSDRLLNHTFKELQNWQEQNTTHRQQEVALHA